MVPQKPQGLDVWEAWAKHLAGRRRPLPLDELLLTESPPLDWAIGDGKSDGPVAKALALLAEAHALPAAAQQLPEKAWWERLNRLQRAAASAASHTPANPWADQLLSVELPLTLAYLFPEVEAFRALPETATQSLSRGMDCLLDGEGLLHARHWPILRPLLACWTRCRAMSAAMREVEWTERCVKRYRGLVRNALRLTRPDGTQTLSADGAGAWRRDMFEAAVRLAGVSLDRDLAALALPHRKGSPSHEIRKEGLPAATVHSEWATGAVLRSGWAVGDATLAVAFHDGQVCLELHVGRGVVWSGAWGLSIRRDGRAVAPPKKWEEVCWVADEQIDYLELEGVCGRGLRVQRHVLLARDDRLLLLADAILADRGGDWEYCGTLPLAAGAAFQPAAETRDGFLMRGKSAQALVLPLALREWRVDPRGGELAATPAGLELRQQAQGAAMFAPLFFDLDPRRMKRPCTWRRLTVAENLVAQPDEVAVGYRVQCGGEQWLIYRSLAPVGNRTVLGHNLVSEMLVAEFDGEVETLLETE